MRFLSCETSVLKSLRHSTDLALIQYKLIYKLGGIERSLFTSNHTLTAAFTLQFQWRNVAWLKRRQNESIARALGSLKKCSRHLCIQYQSHCLIGSVSRRSENYRISFSCGCVQALSHLIQKKKINKFVSLHSIHFQTAWQTNWIAAQITEIVGLLINLRADENKNKHVCRFSQFFLVVC